MAGFGRADGRTLLDAEERRMNDEQQDRFWKLSSGVKTGKRLGYDHSKSVAIQSDGKSVSTGYINNGSNDDFAVVRYIGGSLTLAPIYYLLQ